MRVWLPAIIGGSGVDVFTRRLAAALQCRGVNAEISWYPIHYQFAPFLLRTVSPPHGTDIVHATSWNGFAFKRRGIPLVVTEQLNVLNSSYRPFKTYAQRVYHQTLIRSFVKASFRTASAITAVSHSTAASLKTMLPTQPARVIYNFVNTRIFHPNTIPRQTHRPFRLLFVGNLTRRKGADMLIPIMKNLGAQFELHFTSGLRNLELKDIPSNMKPLGRITNDNDLATAYKDCDALLFPSRFEGLPIAPLEAMACGKPVIASLASSLPEVVEHAVTGELCDPDAIDTFVAACEKLAASPETLHAYGTAARNRVEALFSEEIIVPQYIDLYEKLAAG